MICEKGKGKVWSVIYSSQTRYRFSNARNKENMEEACAPGGLSTDDLRYTSAIAYSYASREREREITFIALSSGVCGSGHVGLHTILFPLGLMLRGAVYGLFQHLST